MFRFSPTQTPFHRLDPRSKLFLQAGFAAVSLAVASPAGTAAQVGLAAVVLRVAGLSLLDFLRAVRGIVLLLVCATVVGAVQLGPPWIDPTGAREPGLAGLRVLALLAVALVYVRSTPIRSSQAAVRWAVPGRLGRAAALGVGLVFRLVPVLRAELESTRAAVRARGGTARPVSRRMQLVGVVGLARALDRTDRLTHALLARCLSWQPTAPPLAPTRADVPAIAAGLVLFAWALA